MAKFRINRVYTRTGDDGHTGLVGGTRVSKSDLRVEAYGDIDELNSSLGLAKVYTTGPTASLKALIEFLQQELFDIGSELATEPGVEYPEMWRATESHVKNLEQLCDRYGEGLPELRSFILPGGSALAAALHLSRTIARRAERTVIALAEVEGEGSVNPELLKYLNRLSDLLFVLARWSLKEDGLEAPLWVQEKDRKLP